MEERDVDRRRTTLDEAKRPLRSYRVRAPRQGKTSGVDDLVLRDRLRTRIAALERSDRVRMIPIYEQVIDPKRSDRWLVKLVRHEFRGTEADVADFCDLHAKVRVVETRLGPEGLPCGFPTQIHHNGIGYVIHPYSKWNREYMATMGCDIRARGKSLSRRDKIVWYIWKFRDKGLILSGPLSSKVRSPRWECVDCGLRFSPARALEVPNPQLGCARCGCLGHRDLTPDVAAKPMRNITKVGLRRRFKLTERTLSRILSAELVRPVQE